MRIRLGKLQRQVADALGRLFVPREVFVRSDGRVRYMRISRRQQIVAAAVAAAVAGWTVASAAGVIAGAFFFDSQGAQLRESTLANERLHQQVTASYARFADLAEALRHQRTIVSGEAAEAGAAADDPERMIRAGADPARRVVSETTAAVAVLASERQALEDRLAAVRGELAALDRARWSAAAARDRYADAWRSSEDRLAAARGWAAGLLDGIAGLHAEVVALRRVAADGDVARRALERRVAALSRSLAAAAAENHRLDRSLTGLQRTMAVIADDRRALREARDELSAQVALLQGRMSSMQATQQDIVQRLAERTRMTVTEIEKAVVMTGLDVDGLLDAAAGKAAGAGGPFVPVAQPRRSAEERTLYASIRKLDGEVDRWGRLQLVLRSLPLAEPLDGYTFLSGFGERKDPINGKRAIHAGVDLKSRLGTPVLATAPGTAVYAGWMGDYGRIVEIDHGLGIRTRYAHLKSISVKVGQAVEFGQKLGKLGNSGRSTGPHLHYEVQVNGKPFDPMNFMEAGKYVFKG